MSTPKELPSSGSAPPHNLNGGATAGTSLKLLAALAELLQAHTYADDAQRDIWDFAVEIQRLKELGLSGSDFRWLTCKGYVQHRREVTDVDDDARVFRATGALSFTKRTCFVLTKSGRSFASQVVCGHSGSNDPIGSPARSGPNGWPPGTVPHWDPQRHQLHLGKWVIKQFKWSAANQEALLSAFEEEGWPARIDDPLPPKPGQDPRRRLHDTIKCLNHNQKNQLIRFKGDGTGEGVLWEFLTDSDSVRQP